MTVRNLEYLFSPRSVAVIGASERQGSVGRTVLGNLLAAGFKGAIFPVNPKHSVLAGLSVYPSAAALPSAPDLAIICTPPAAVPGIIAQLGERGTRAAIVLTAGVGAMKDASGLSGRDAMLAAAKPY